MLGVGQDLKRSSSPTHYYLLFHRVLSACTEIVASQAITFCALVRPYKAAVLDTVAGHETCSTTLCAWWRAQGDSFSSRKKLLTFHYANRGKVGWSPPYCLSGWSQVIPARISWAQRLIKILSKYVCLGVCVLLPSSNTLKCFNSPS